MDADTALRRIGYVNLPAQFEEERAEILQAVEGVFRRSDFIGGEARYLRQYMPVAKCV